MSFSQCFQDNGESLVGQDQDRKGLSNVGRENGDKSAGLVPKTISRLLVNLEIYILYTKPPLISSLSFLWAFIAVLSSSVTSEQKVH